MPNTPHMSEEQFHEFHLDGKQMVFLFMASTVVAVVIFLCGVMVGRGVREGQTAVLEAGSGVDPTATGAEPLPAPADLLSTPPEELAEAVAEDITYPRWLDGPSAEPEALREPTAPREKPAPAAVVPPAPAPAAPAKTAAGQPARPEGKFVVQVTSLTELAPAEAAARRLRGKGYPSFVESTTTGRPQFRVRVGPYATKQEAEAVASRLEKQEKFGKPWIPPAS